MKKTKLFRGYHSFYTPYKNTLQEQDSEANYIHMRLRPLNNAPVFKVKTGLERFLKKYPDYQMMFIGSKK